MTPKWLRHWHQMRQKWLNGPIVWLLIVMIAFSSAMAMGEPALLQQVVTPQPSETAANSPARSVTPEGQTTPVPGEPAITPLPDELIANREQTFGIILGTIMLVMIVIIGTLSGIAAQRKNVS